MLKYNLDKETFEKLDETMQSMYKSDGDRYVLQVEGATSKEKLNEFRDNNTKLLADAKKYQDIDMDKYNAVMERDRQIRDKELIDKGEFDTLINEKMHVIKSDLEAKLQTSVDLATDYESRYNREVAKSVIDGAAGKAFATHKIRPEAQEMVLTSIRNQFVVKDGVALAMSGENILIGQDGNLTVDEYVSSQPDFTKVPNVPGNSSPNVNGQPMMQPSNTSVDRITVGLKKVLSR